MTDSATMTGRLLRLPAGGWLNDCTVRNAAGKTSYDAKCLGREGVIK